MEHYKVHRSHREWSQEETFSFGGFSLLLVSSHNFYHFHRLPFPFNDFTPYFRLNTFLLLVSPLFPIHRIQCSHFVSFSSSKNESLPIPILVESIKLSKASQHRIAASSLAAFSQSHLKLQKSLFCSIIANAPGRLSAAWWDYIFLWWVYIFLFLCINNDWRPGCSRLNYLLGQFLETVSPPAP